MNSVLSEQISIFRINCVDCLDRTNVVQAAIAKIILEMMVDCTLVLIEILLNILVEESCFIRF